MFLEIYFWLLLALTIIPFPFKIAGYLTGKDNSPAIVKGEEIINTIFTSVGLIGFYGYLNNEHYLYAAFWYGWLAVSVLFSVIAIFKSPKLKYATKVMGKKNTVFLASISTALYIPLYYVLYQYANQ